MSRHVTSLALACLPLVMACGQDPAPDNTSSSSTTYVDLSGGVDMELNGVKIEVESPVQYAYESQTGPEGSHGSMTLDGHPFGIQGGILFIGEVEYGAVEAGGVVRIDEGGVYVDGELRGALPPAKTGD